MATSYKEDLSLKIERLETRLAEAEELIEAIKAGEVDAFALGTSEQAEVFTLQSGDYAYRVLIEKISEGALNLTEEGLIVYTNGYFSQLTGIPYEKILGSPVFDLIHPDSEKEFNSLFAQALNGNSKGEINLEVNGKSIPVYVSLTSLQPKLATVGMIITDLTEKKQNEKVIQQYEQSDKLKSDFIKMASHELNTPVTSIKGYTQMLLAMLRESVKDNSYSLEFTTTLLVKIDKQVLRLVRLISELLDLSRIEGGQLKLRKEIFNIGQLLSEVIEDIQVVHPLQKFNLLLNISPEVEADKDRISQVLSNLILNAIKYTSRSSDIDITLNSAPNNNIAISIRDYGIGINEEDYEKIFERFYRSEKKDEETYPGFGIGLFISKDIMKRHHGNILVESEKGKGSTFTIILPVISKD